MKKYLHKLLVGLAISLLVCSQTAFADLGKGTVIGDTVNFRESASLSAKILKQFAKNTVIDLIAKEGDWYKAKSGDQTGYIYAKYVRPRTAEVSRSGETTTRSYSTDVVSKAKTLLGIKYVYGGSTTAGFDCSGFTQYVFRQAGKSIPRVAADQSKTGQAVDRDKLQVGDLVFFNTTGGGVSHVGIFIGDGQFIHSSSGGGKVMISSMSSDYYKARYVNARRVD